MNLKQLFILLPLASVSLVSSAEELNTANQGTTFQFSTEVSRIVEKDLMNVSLYSRKSGKSLTNLKNEVSANLNKVLKVAKEYPDIEVQTDGISNSVNYGDKNKVNGWIAEGYINLKSKNFTSIEKVLERLDSQIAIESIRFSVSPQIMKALEDEMTLEVIKEFNHKAEVIQKGLNAKNHQIVNVELSMPNNSTGYYGRPMMAMAKMTNSTTEEMPLEAGKETISTTASGKIKFE